MTAPSAIMARIMPGWETRWTNEQKEAVSLAYEDRKIRPYTRVAALAKAGELEHEGRVLEPFDMPTATIRGEVQRLRRRRAGEIGSELATLPAADAIEQLRRRLINAADAMLRTQETRRAKERDPELLRQIARCVREAAAIPAPDPRPRRPGQRKDGDMVDGQTSGGLASKILQAHKGSEAAPRHKPHQAQEDNSTAQHHNTHAQTDEQHDDTTQEEPLRPPSLQGSRHSGAATPPALGG